MIDIGLAGATLGGLLSLLSPCSVMLLPAFFAYAFGTLRQILVRTAIFYLGLVASLVPLGVFASALGSLITANRQVMINVVGALIIVAGALLLLGVNIPLPGRRVGTSTHQTADRTSIASTFLLGTVYAVAGVCAGPILGSVLLVASLGSPVYGALLMACYALGMCLPLIVLAVLWGRLGAPAMAWLRPRTVEVRVGRFTWRNSWMTIISGLLTMTVGVLLLVTEGTARLSGWLDVATQFRLESGALAAAGSVGNIWFVFAALLVVVAVVLLTNREPVDRCRPLPPSSGRTRLWNAERRRRDEDRAAWELEHRVCPSLIGPSRVTFAARRRHHNDGQANAAPDHRGTGSGTGLRCGP